MHSHLTERVSALSGKLYRDHFHLLCTLSMTVGDCGYLLDTVDMGTEDSGRRVVNVYGPFAFVHCIMFSWSMTEHGNLEGNFIFT